MQTFQGASHLPMTGPCYLSSNCSRPSGIGLQIFRLQNPSAHIADLDDFPKMIESHLYRPLHAGRGVDPLPCDVLHRTILLQRGVAVKHEGVVLVT